MGVLHNGICYTNMTTIRGYFRLRYFLPEYIIRNKTQTESPLSTCVVIQNTCAQTFSYSWQTWKVVQKHRVSPCQEHMHSKSIAQCRTNSYTVLPCWDSQSYTQSFHQATSLWRPPESPVQGKSKQGWIPAGLQQSQKMKHYEPSGDPLILLQHPHSSAAVSEYFYADRCRTGFSLSDLSSSFKTYTAYLETQPRCFYSLYLHPQNSFRPLCALVGESNLWHCKHYV